MSLVAYDSSGSESETEDINENHKPAPKPEESTNGIASSSDRKRKQPIRILAPSLEDIPEDEEEKNVPQKKLKLDTERKSGLLKMLPPPRKFLKTKKTTDLVPHVVAKKPPPAPRLADSDDDEECGPSQFFTLDVPASSTHLPGTSLPPIPVHVPAVETPMEVEHTVALPPDPEILKQFVTSPDEMPDTCLPDNLDLEVLRKLQGKTNLGREDIQIIDVHADDQRTDPNVWLTKQLSVEKNEEKKSGDQPSAMHKRKHQITYLAHQAKERELELKNQWALNRMTRQQSQSKYGF